MLKILHGAVFQGTLLCFVLIFTQCLNPTSAENTTVKSDTCSKEEDGIFPCSNTITGNIILMCFYGIVLGVGAKLISDGAEMLLDFGFSPSIIGGVILPILGAVPDSAIIVASGLGSDAQDKLSVGMGTLAGSTVMLLTIAWSASLFVSRCQISSNTGVSVDRKCKGFSLVKQGMTPMPEVRPGIIIMLLTSLFYFIVQTADWIYGATKTENQPAYVKDAALANMVICIVGLIGYTIYSVFDSKRNDRRMKLRKEEVTKRKVLHTLLIMADKQAFKSPLASRRDITDGTKSPEEENEEAVSKKYFKAWHVKKGLRKAQERLGETDEEEELLGSESGSGTMSPQSDSNDEKEESKSVMTVKCAGMLIGGVALVTIFSDPMCDVLSALSNKSNKSYIPISSFYISFVITPFCSNASELVSSLIFASKKTRESATMTFSQLYGAATMNNTLCLGVFMALVYFKDLEWYYGAEVLCIVIVQWIVGLISLSKTYRIWMTIPVSFSYILCLVLVYLLEHFAHWY